jgi:hypothetical protein
VHPAVDLGRRYYDRSGRPRCKKHYDRLPGSLRRSEEGEHVTEPAFTNCGAKVIAAIRTNLDDGENPGGEARRSDLLLAALRRRRAA